MISTSLQTLAVASLISITWLMLGYSLAFGNGSDGRFIGGAEKFWYMGDAKTSTDDDGKQRVWPESMVGTIPESVSPPGIPLALPSTSSASLSLVLWRPLFLFLAVCATDWRCRGLALAFANLCVCPVSRSS